jgi:hypothetical protein
MRDLPLAKQGWCVPMLLLWLQMLINWIDPVGGDRSWHIFHDDHQSAKHSPYFFPYAQFIREAWNSSANALEASSYTELEFDRAIEIIYRHQHPVDCSKVNYMISGGSRTSFAWGIHLEAYGLGVAMTMNRVYLPNPYLHSSNKWKLPPEICGKANNTWDCYFEPWTNCSWEDMTAVRGDRNLTTISRESPELANETVIDHPDRVVELKIHNDRSHQFQRVPNITAFETIIDWQRIHPRFRFYWWRAVASAYLAVPNSLSRSLMREHAMPGAYNVSGQCIAMYLPNGDQHDNFTAFGAVAEDVYATAVREQGKYHRFMVVGSSNPTLLNDAIAYSGAHGWVLAYNPLHHLIFKGSGLISTHLTHLRAHYRKFERSKNFLVDEMSESYRDHLPLEFASNIIYLADFMQCNAYVCSLASSFCRLLDEMRAVVGMKPQALFADISEETCLSPPCLTDNRKFKTLIG